MSGKKRPLEGKTCLVMRSASQAKPLMDGIIKLGGHPILVPLIAFRMKPLTEREFRVFHNLPAYDWIIFTSQNGVKFFMEQLQETGATISKHIKIAAVGTKTANCISEYGLQTDYVPKEFTGDVLAEELEGVISKKERVCVVKGNLARDRVGKMLQTKGVTVDTIVSYETYLPEESKVKLMETMDKINIDVFIFTSPSTVKHFVEILGEKYKELLHKKWIASIGPVTENVLETYQIPVHISPSVYTINGLLDELETYFKTFE